MALLVEREGHDAFRFTGLVSLPLKKIKEKYPRGKLTELPSEWQRLIASLRAVDNSLKLVVGALKAPSKATEKDVYAVRNAIKAIGKQQPSYDKLTKIKEPDWSERKIGTEFWYAFQTQVIDSINKGFNPKEIDRRTKAMLTDALLAREQPGGVLQAYEDELGKTIRKLRRLSRFAVEWLHYAWSLGKQILKRHYTTQTIALGKVGPFSLQFQWTGQDADDPRDQAYIGDAIGIFRQAAKDAYKGLKGLGVPEKALKGPITLKVRSDFDAGDPHRHESIGGWYGPSDNRLIVYLKRDVVRADLRWTVLHEVAHRVFFKGLTANGRNHWSRFIASVGEKFTEEEAIGILAWIHGARKSKPLPKAGKLGGDDVGWSMDVGIYYDGLTELEGDKRLGPVVRKAMEDPHAVVSLKRLWVGKTFWGFFVTQVLGGRDDAFQAKSLFYDWLIKQRHTNELPSLYANFRPWEAFAEVVPAVILGRGHPGGRRSTRVGPLVKHVLMQLVRFNLVEWTRRPLRVLNEHQGA